MDAKGAPNRLLPTLSPYQPTLRDRVANRLLGLLGGGSQAQGFVQNLLGSTGLGQQHPVLADFTGLTLPFQADEAGRQIAHGHPVAGGANLLLAALPLPVAARGASGAVHEANRLIPQAVERVAEPITAYHGSPHIFDEFSLDHIGTGEGAQAYGRGLYFAENENVARSYRDALRPSGLRLTGPDGQSVVAPPSSHEIIAPLVDAMRGVDGPEYMKTAIARAHLSGEPDQVGTAFRNAFGFMHMTDAERSQARAHIGRMIQEAKPHLNGFTLEAPGAMYKVGIHTQPNSLMDWDAPLAEQPRALAALEPYGATGMVARSDAGTAFRQIQDNIGPDRAANALMRSGVSGIRYFDNGSRGIGRGTRNFVVFNPAIIDIMKRYGVAAPVAASMLAAHQSQPQAGAIQ